MEAAPFRLLQVRPEGDVLVIAIARPSIRGDDVTIPFRDELVAAVQRHAPRKVVLDFQHVKEMASRGFAALTVFYQELVKDRGGQVALCGLSPFLRDALNVIRFIDTNDPASAPGEASSVKPLFGLVAADVAEATAKLNSVPTGP